MIKGVVAAVPRNIVRNTDLRFVKATGVAERRVAVAPTDALWPLARTACEELLGGIGAWKPDNLVFVTQTPTVRMPAMSCAMARFINFNGPAFDVNLACSGYVYGLWLAAKLGGKTLLIAGDTVSRMIDANDPATSMLFGDCVTASAVEGSYINAVMGTDGSGWGSLIADPWMRMDGIAVFNFAMSTVPGLVEQTTMNGFMDWYLFHQANALMLNGLVKKCNLDPAKVPMNIQRYGNTSSASIPLLMCDSECTEALRTKVNRVSMMGFGAGWSWGGILTQLEPMKVLNVVEV